MDMYKQYWELKSVEDIIATADVFSQPQHKL